LSVTGWIVTKPLVSDWPNPVQKRARVFSWRRPMVAGESRPETWVRLGSALPTFSAASSRLASTGGKSETCATWCRSIRRTASSASKRGTTTTAAPAWRWARDIPSAVTW